MHKQHQPNAVRLQLIEFAETFFASTGATVCHGGNRAFYAPGLDIVQLPPAEAFDTAESYEATKAHESIIYRKATGSNPTRSHASYLDHWLKVLKADKKAIFTAAGHAQRACDYLFSLQAETPSEVAA
ncbi:antirestriction protein-like protein [Caballeronia terrestris]|jgi:antirestriction protein ArdC|uniref:Antirestriction protein-like protein n=1 Tax=Caballeronia terrestris TaxID=1226301 RepID=A0A158KV86_9BURK|nr:zincin-like metallopeptidase domain-containing protein [Caballeronia terrestris]SAL84520.1 antirestriction protein-like protein [Caballeronia terrestris]